MKNLSSCKCADYPDLELRREEISTRIKDSTRIVKSLELLVENSDGSELFKCRACGQYWQRGLAWNWGGKTFLFKVPAISNDDWQKERFMSPADMLIYSAMMSDYFARNNFKESDKKCCVGICNNRAIVGNVLCVEHFVESLQRIGNLPKRPSGRLFGPYSEEDAAET